MNEIFAIKDNTKAVMKVRPGEKIQACAEFEPMTTVISEENS